MKRAVFLICLVIASTAAAQQGRPTNKNGWLKGTYSFIIHGTIMGVFGEAPHPAVISGWITLDGAGHVTEGVSSVTIDGTTSTIAVVPLFSAYSLDANSYGNMDLNLGYGIQNLIIAAVHLGDSFYIQVKHVEIPAEGHAHYFQAVMSGEATKQGI